MAGKNSKKDPLVQMPMRMPKSLVARLDRAAAAWGKGTTRTAITRRLINDGFRWWEREDLEQDKTLSVIMQMHERMATVLAFQNALVEVMGLRDEHPDFDSKVLEYKQTILNERKREDVLGSNHNMGKPGGSVDSNDDDDAVEADDDLDDAGDVDDDDNH